MQLIYLFFTLAFSNFVFQYFTERDWEAAFDRTWFQGTALFLAWLVMPK